MRHFSIIFTVLACATIAPAQPNRCTQDTVAGTYGVAYQGSVLVTPPGASQAVAYPSAGLSLISIDSTGTAISTGYQASGGPVAKVSMQGTVKINANCTGVLDWGGGTTANLVVHADGKEINSMVTAGPGYSPIIAGRWKRISRIPNTVEPNQCSPESLVGVYAIRQNGYFIIQGAPVPVAMMAMGSIGHDGSGPSKGTASLGGQVVAFGVPNAKFEVKPDCTVTATFDLETEGAGGGASSGWAIVLDGGNELWGIETQDPVGTPVILGTWKRLSPIPAESK